MLPRRLRHSIVTRIVMLGVAMAAIGIAARIAAIHWLLRPEVREQMGHQQGVVAALAARDIDGKIASRQRLVEHLAKTLPPALLERPAELQAWLAERQGIDPLFGQGFVVVAASGDGALAEAPVMPARQGVSYRQADWFAAVRDGRRPSMGRPGITRGADGPAVVVAAPVLAGDGRLLAVLAGIAPLAGQGFLDVVQGMDEGQHGSLALVSPRDRLIVAASEAEKRLVPLPPPGADAVLDSVVARARGSGPTAGRTDENELVTVVPIPSAGWFLVARMSADDALRPANKTFSFVLFNSGIIVLVILFVLAFVLRRIFRPLLLAARQARAMADGEAPLQPLAVHREDEVGELTAAFNYLLRKLQGKEAALLRTMDDLRDREARLKYLAHHDSLTGLPNRVLLSDRLEQALARASRTGHKLALLFLDLDGFKLVNDSHGHEIGDQVLEQVAIRLQDGLRQVDTLARLGGDEFIILLADVENAGEAATLVAEKCIEALRTPFFINGLPMQLGVSVGIACYPEHGRSALSLLAHSDQAMYRAKEKGRNRYESSAAEG